MAKLTEKYVFECALRGKSVKVSKPEFLNTKLLMQYGLISDYDEDRICYVLRNMEVDYVFVVHTLNKGTPLVNMDNRRKGRKSLISKGL